jgi:hypothetical protein
MNFRDSNHGGGEEKYISKKVMINGQFVTLYSANGQTWVSSPEDIPALMERLENARITLTTGEKLPEGEGIKAAKPEAKEKEEERSVPPKVLQTKYRLKGPKPRPILRQDGLVIQGTPIEPISASSTTLSFSSDVEVTAKSGAPSASAKKAPKHKGKVHKAPVFQKKVAPAITAKAAKPAADSKKLVGAAKNAKTSVAKTAPVKAVPAKGVKAPVAKPAAPQAKAVKSAKKVSPVPAAKPAKKQPAKAAAKKPSAKKSTNKKTKTGKR